MTYFMMGFSVWVIGIFVGIYTIARIGYKDDLLGPIVVWPIAIIVMIIVLPFLWVYDIGDWQRRRNK